MANTAMIVGLPDWLLEKAGVPTGPNLKYEPGDTGTLPDTSMPGQTSWTETPPVTPWPTAQDVAGARAYKKKYGNPNEVAIDPYATTNVVHGDDDPKGVSTSGQFKEWQLGSSDRKMRPARETYGEETARDLYGSQIAANTSPTAALGFDPDAFAVSRPADAKNLGNTLGMTMSGLDKQRGEGVHGSVSYPMYAHMDPGAATTPVHESIHRGIAFVLEDPANKDLKERMRYYDDKGGTGNEYLTRATMIRRYGNVEASESHGGGDHKPHPQIKRAEFLMNYDPKFLELMQDIDKRAAHMGAQRLITKQGGVYQHGGRVQVQDDDFSDKYNTPLTPEEEAQYQRWIQQQSQRHGRDLSKDNYDYDTRGLFRGLNGDDIPLGHGPDTYKKPNHPTFSNESIYHGTDGHYGGRWDADETGSETLQPYDPRFEEGGRVQGEGEDDRVEPTEEDRQNNEFIVRGRDAGDRIPTYTPEDLQRRPVGPQSDEDFEPRRRIRKQLDDPGHGSWHDDGKYQIYTPHPSFFAEVDPRHLVEYFHQYHPEDHRLHLP